MLVVDATSSIVDQDKALADRILKEGRACVIVLNKWDMIPDKTEKKFIDTLNHVRLSLPNIRWAEVCTV